MITRIWRGVATQANADIYENLLKTEIFPGIFAKKIPGFRRIDLMRRDAGAEVEFMTVMWFDSIDAVKAFIPGDHETAYMPESARKVLARWDARVQHFDLRDTRLAD